MALKSTGYQAAATTITWTSGQDLDSLTDNEWTDLTDEVDNSTNKYTYVDVRVALGSAAFTGSDSALEVYLVPSIDGSTYPKWTGNTTTSEQQNDEFFVDKAYATGATEAQELAVRNILVPPGKYKWGFRSRANVTLAGSGNTPQWRPHSLEDA